jgi:ABC-2 type transport system ATP-binding protein
VQARGLVFERGRVLKSSRRGREIVTIPTPANTKTVSTATPSLATQLLEVHELRVTYGRRVAVDGVSFVVGPREIFGLLGPNGAGKTSILSAIEGLLVPAGGSVRVVGIDVRKRTLDARANLGVQLQSTSFQKDLRVSQIVQLYSGLYGAPLSPADARALLATIGLGDCGGMKSGQLSGGQLQRLALATATLHDPPLLLLDEPTTGLDPRARRQFWSKIEALRDAGRGILLTTHSMEEAHAVCNRIAIIDHGHMIATGVPQDIIDANRDRAEVRAAARRSEVTLEDVFIGLTRNEESTS